MSVPGKETLENESEKHELLVPTVFFQKNEIAKRASKSKLFGLTESRNSTASNDFAGKVPPKIIECRVEFITFGEVDTFNEQFKAHVLIRSRWSVDEIMTEYNPKKDWNPKLFVENAIPEKFYEEINYKLEKFDNKTEITEVRSCKGFDQIFFLNFFF